MTTDEPLLSNHSPSRLHKFFQSLSIVNRQNISPFGLLSALLNTVKTLSHKRAVKIFAYSIIVSYLLFTAYGLVWLALQSDLHTENTLKSVPLCPCQVSVTWDEEQFGFDVDPACDARKSNYWNCRLHQGAKGCYRRKSKTSPAGAQCCYDNDGKWIDDWKKGAGTLDFYYPATLRNISTYGHFFSDALSYFSCCIGINKIFNACESYMKYRPPGQCENIPLTSANTKDQVDSSTSKIRSCISNECGQ